VLKAPGLAPSSRDHLLSDGGDNQSHVSRENPSDMAQRASHRLHHQPNISGMKGKGDKVL